MLLAVAEIQPHWLFVGRDIDLRCVRMSPGIGYVKNKLDETLICDAFAWAAINLALRNLYGFVIWGNSLADERRLVYRTGFDLKGFISEVPLGDLPEPVQQFAANPALLLTEDSLDSVPLNESHCTPTDDHGEVSPRRVNQLRHF